MTPFPERAGNLRVPDNKVRLEAMVVQGYNTRRTIRS